MKQARTGVLAVYGMPETAMGWYEERLAVSVVTMPLTASCAKRVRLAALLSLTVTSKRSRLPGMLALPARPGTP